IYNGTQSIERGLLPAGSRMLPREQHIEKHSEGVDIGGAGHLTAAYLLGSGIVGCERVAGKLSELGNPRGIDSVIEELRYTEIHEFDLPLGRDQDIRGLEITMQDELGMCMRYRRQHVQKQTNDRVGLQPARIAPVLDRFAFDIFDHEIG